jgi:hypothetical protein
MVNKKGISIWEIIMVVFILLVLISIGIYLLINQGGVDIPTILSGNSIPQPPALPSN